MIHTMIVNTPDGGTLNMRERPGKSGDVIAKIPNGTPVGITGETADWKQLEYNEKSGWVMAKYLKEPNNDPQEQIIVPKEELEKIYDIIGNWLGLRG